MKRDFKSGLPNFLWLTDITEFSLPAGKACLSPVIDCFDGAVVSWNAPAGPDADLANGMLEAACSTLAPGEHPVIHASRGCRYRWPGRISICGRHGPIRPVSAKGCSPDDPASGGLFGRLKDEFFCGRDRSGASTGASMGMLAAHLRYYNEGRLKGSLGWMSPMQFRRSLGLAT